MSLVVDGSTDAVAAFLERLGGLDHVLRVIVSDARLRVRFTIRGSPERAVLLDLLEQPVRSTPDDGSHAPDVMVTMTSETWHRVLLGELAPGEALGRREMLLRGSAADLARCIPLFDFAPMLYREHMAAERCAGRKDKTMQEIDRSATAVGGSRGVTLPLSRLTGTAAYVLGFGLGMVRKRVPGISLFDLLGAMSRGLEDAHKRLAPGKGKAR
jgi:hypothetical protein